MSGMRNFRPRSRSAAWPGGRALAAWIAILAAVAPASAATAVDAVARVNGRDILRRDFNLAVQLQFQGRAAGIGLAELRGVRDKVLERLIDSELLHQRAARAGVEVAEPEVAAEIGRLREAFGSEESFASALKENGVGEVEFRDQVRRSLVVTRFVEQKVVGDVRVEEAELRRYYEQNPGEMVRPERVRVRQILIQAAPDSAPARAAARQKIEAILKELKAGGSFADLARKHSDGPEAGRGGDAGWLTRRSAPPPIERAVFQLQAGETSDVVETRAGFHLLRVEERQREGPIPFEEVKEAIRAKMLARERDAKLRDYVTGLREKARIERLLAPGPS